MTEEPTVSRASGDFYIYAKSKKTHRWSRRSAGAEKSLKKEEVQHHICLSAEEDDEVVD